MQSLRCCFVVVGLALGVLAAAALGQTPVLEDLLINASKIAGQWGSGIFSNDGYTLTQSGGTDPLGHPRSVDYVWYNLPGVGSDGSGSFEFDVTGLYSQSGVNGTELMASCDSTGLSPATTGGDFYLSPYNVIMKKECYPGDPQIDKVKVDAYAAGTSFGLRSNTLSWNGTTTYRFRITWSGTTMRVYRGLPGETLTLLSPPTPYNFGVSWSPGILHIQIGSTFRAGPRGIQGSGGVPGSMYSLLRVYEEDIGNVATPPRVIPTVVSVDLETTDVEYFLRRVSNGDGDTVPVTIGGRGARRTDNPANDFYIYFDAASIFAYQGSKPDLYILIDYYDTDSGALGLQYDSSDPGGQPNPYYKTGESVTLTGSNTWKQYMYHVTDAYFGNRENNGADFRITQFSGSYIYLDTVAVSNLTFLPGQVSNPNPPNQATKVSTSADLSWTAGRLADSYNVYFGLTNPPAFQGNQTQTTFDPGTMDRLKTYYWRIDVVNNLGTTTGNVWRFTTVTAPGDLDEDHDVDQEDFGRFQACFSGHSFPYPAGCEAADFDLDNDVDMNDFGMFQSCMGGPNQPPGC